MNLSTFEDNIGITCSSPKVECYVLACNSEGNTFIDNHGTRSIMLTMSNPSAQDCTISYRLPKGFTVNAALLCQMDAEPQRVTPNIEDGVLSLQAPKSFVSAMLLIDEAKSENSWTAYTEQLDRDTFAVQMMNYLDKEIALQIDAGFEKKDVVIPPFSPARMDFRSPDKQKKPVIVPVTISGEGRKVKLLTAFGPDYRPPELEKPLVKITKESPLSFDFEENRYSSDNPRDGRRSLKLIGNGKFCCVNYHILLEPNSKYEIEFDLCKSPDCSGEKRKCFVLVCNYTEGRKRLDYLKPCADENEVPRDGQYHHVRHEFRTFNDVTDPVVYIYNSDSEDGVIFLDNLRIRRL
jgi:hypothetical protein